MNNNLALNLTSSARRHPERPALLMDRQAVTYAQLERQTALAAGLLARMDIGVGDAVGLMLPNVPEFAAAYYGILQAGGIVVPMNVLLKEREVAFYLSDSGARLLIGWEGFSEAAQTGAKDAGAECLIIGSGWADGLSDRGARVSAMVDRAEDDTAVILYTSGTTGKPKGAELTHGNLGRNVEVTVRTLIDVQAEDVVLGALPLFHAFGQTCGLNSAVAAGCALALVPRFSPEAVLQSIERHRVTVFEGVPTMYAALLHDATRGSYDRSSLRCCVSGGAALPVEALKGFEESFGCIILEGYGLSETSPVACFNHPDRERVPGSIGTPVEGVEMRLVDDQRRVVGAGGVGEIAIRGHNIMKGYLNRPDATAEAIDGDGWFYSGDIARVDAEGRYYLVDRKKELIIRGGYNVYPREIEEVLYEHPAIREAAVIGIPHDELGEEVGAAVVLKPGCRASGSELRDYMKANVAAYKYPRHIWFLKELPKGPTGKILKREITAPVGMSGGVR